MRAPFVIPLLLLVVSVSALPLPDLAVHRWKKRVLVIDTPKLNDPPYLQQAGSLLPAWIGLKERDLHLITRSDASAFRIRLIGKDGGVKLDSDRPLSAEEIFAVIDVMPMRRDESAEARSTNAPRTR